MSCGRRLALIGGKRFLSAVAHIEWLERAPGLDREEWERLGRLPSSVKVDMCLDMSDAVMRICAEGIRAQDPGMSEEELIEKLRERIAWSKRWQKR